MFRRNGRAYPHFNEKNRAKEALMPLASSSYPLLNVFWTIFIVFLP